MATTYLKLFEVIGRYWLLLVDIVRFEKVNKSSTKSTSLGKGTKKQESRQPDQRDKSTESV